MELQEIEYRSTLYNQLLLKQAQLSSIDQKLDNNKVNEFDTQLSSYDEEDYKRVVDKFQNKDSEIKAHEQTHTSLANTTTAIHYSYQKGPDGKFYAIGAEVRFDTSMPQDKDEAILKLDTIQQATNTSLGMSSADSTVAISANLNKLLLLQSKNQEKLF